MADMIVVERGGEEPDDRADEPRRDRRTWVDVMHPEQQRNWRELPHLIGDSFRLVWAAGRTEFLVTSALQLLTALGVAAQLFVGKEVLEAVLGAGDFGSVLPALAALVAIAVVLDFAAAVESELSRVLAELVGRRATERVIDVAARVDLLAFESPAFYDRLMRANAQGHFRSLQTVDGLLA